MAPQRRPTPLTEDGFEGSLVSGRGPTLLGRLGPASPLVMMPGAHPGLLKPTSIRHSTPGSRQVLATPLATPGLPSGVWWPFTPMETPSPSARLLAFEQGRIATPGAPARSLRAVAQSAAWADVSEEATSPEEAAPYLSEDAAEDDVDRHQQPESAALASIGSQGHSSGTCKRCCFFPRGKCLNGYDCRFCHYDHEKPKRQHKSRRGKPSVGPEPSRAPGIFARPMVQFAPPALPRQVVQYPNGMCCLIQPVNMAVTVPWIVPSVQPQQSVITLQPALMPMRPM